MGSATEDMTEEKFSEETLQRLPEEAAVEPLGAENEGNMQFVFATAEVPEPLLTIKADGTVVGSVKLKPDETAKLILQAIEDVCKERGGLYKNKLYIDCIEKAKSLMLVGDLEGAEEKLDALIKMLS